MIKKLVFFIQKCFVHTRDSWPTTSTDLGPDRTSQSDLFPVFIRAKYSVYNLAAQM